MFWRTSAALGTLLAVSIGCGARTTPGDLSEAGVEGAQDADSIPPCQYQTCTGIATCPYGKVCPVGDGCDTCVCDLTDGGLTRYCSGRGCSCQHPNIVYCSSNCGPVDAGTEGAVACAPGQICGADSTLTGFGCCDADGEACYTAYPAPGTPGCQ